MKYFRNLGYLFSLIPAVLVIWGNLQGGWWTLANFLFSLVFLALMELVLGSDQSNFHGPAKDPFPEGILFAHVLFHTASIVTLFYGIAADRLQGIYIFTAALSTGVESGTSGVVIAHELIHKIDRAKRMTGKFLLASVGNIYFYVHHLRVHHKLVGLEADGATARRGESLYSFFVRTLNDQWVQGWSSEKERLERKRMQVYSLSNELLMNAALQVLFMLVILLFTGLSGIFAYLVYTFMATLLLEYVNYIEHYGLQRTAGEKVGYTHSWNCDKRVSRFMLIDLSRHADHHFHPNKPYHTLLTAEVSPMLPGGYASLVLPALIPVWWFRIVHKRLDMLHSEDREVETES
jgi:alkane 1-monooxygenase